MTLPKSLEAAESVRTQRQQHRIRRNGFGTALVLVLLVFGRSLVELAAFSFSDPLYSHILLVPLISLYFVWTTRARLPAPAVAARGPAFAAAAGVVALIGGYAVANLTGHEVAPQTALAFTTAAFVLSLVGVVAWLLGRPMLRAIAFPLGFLVFMVPLPASWLAVIETGLQYGSAEMARLFLVAVGTPVYYHDLSLQVPNITLRVAPECSGIHSTLALLIVSVIAGHVCLRSRWRAALLVGAIVPLALLRNGFRIFTIAELCAHIGPQMIDSPIHHRGGPLFFALSLLPLWWWLRFLMRRDQRAS